MDCVLGVPETVINCHSYLRLNAPKEAFKTFSLYHVRMYQKYIKKAVIWTVFLDRVIQVLAVIYTIAQMHRKKSSKTCYKSSHFFRSLQRKVTKNITFKRLYFQAKGRFLNVLPLLFDCTYLQC